jgi:hypothetical protein
MCYTRLPSAIYGDQDKPSEAGLEKALSKGGKSPRQLEEYVNGAEIALLKEENEVRAFLVVVVGSRQVLIWEMSNGDSQKDPELAS